jgi:hypothetical protein
MTERRKFKRYPITYPVECENGQEKKAFAMMDVSENGLSFTTPDAIHERDVLDLHIFLKKKMFNVKAVVVYARRGKRKGMFNIGAKFMRPPDDFRVILSQEVEDISQLLREANLYSNKNISFKKASMKYLENFPS